MEDGSHSLHRLQWRERLRVGAWHFHTLASASLPKEWRLPLAVIAVVLLLQVFFSAQVWELLVVVLLGAAELRKSTGARDSAPRGLNDFRAAILNSSEAA